MHTPEAAVFDFYNTRYYRANRSRCQAAIHYKDLLSSTGMADAVTLCAGFGFDITTPDFWRSSLDIIRGQIAEFEGMV